MSTFRSLDYAARRVDLNYPDRIKAITKEDIQSAVLMHSCRHVLGQIKTQEASGGAKH